jgi:hypothetical protein
MEIEEKNVIAVDTAIFTRMPKQYLQQHQPKRHLLLRGKQHLKPF